MATRMRFVRAPANRPSQGVVSAASSPAMTSRHRLTRLVPVATLCCAFLLAPGCSRIRVSQENVAGADLSTIRSYAWHPTASRLPRDARIDETSLDRQLRDALAAAFAANGIAEALEDQTPHTLVAYRVTIRRKSTSTSVNEATGYATGWSAYRDDEGYRGVDSGGTYLEEWEQGRLVVELMTRDGLTVLWRGTAKTEINFDNPPAERERRLRKAAAKLVGQLGATH